MLESEKITKCLKALSAIESYTTPSEGMKRTPVLYDNLILLAEYFVERREALNPQSSQTKSLERINSLPLVHNVFVDNYGWEKVVYGSLVPKDKRDPRRSSGYCYYVQKKDLSIERISAMLWSLKELE